jgi:uncharacterized SAM-binding protein YcdF (DUF218 family)
MVVVISQLFTAFALPPGCIIAVLALITFFISRRYKSTLVLVTALLYLLSIEPVADLLLRPLEDAYPPLPNLSDTHPKKTLALVVLGGGTVQGSPEAGSELDTLTSDAVKRAVYAFTLRNDFYGPYIFSGGRVFDYGQDTEAATAGRLWTSLGLHRGRFMLETNSRNTWENAKETARLGYKQIVLVTSAYHMPRSVFCFERNGMTVIPAPTDYKCDRSKRYDFFSFMPSMKSLNKSYIALHEYIGSLSYHLMYRL